MPKSATTMCEGPMNGQARAPPCSAFVCKVQGEDVPGRQQPAAAEFHKAATSSNPSIVSQDMSSSPGKMLLAIRGRMFLEYSQADRLPCAPSMVPRKNMCGSF